jgi:hypothetical protein
VTTTFDATGTADGAPPWRDPTISVADRVQLLLEEMTLEEKVAQLGSRWVGNDMHEPGSSDDPDPGLVTGNDAGLNVAPMQDVFAASGNVSLEAASRHGLGHLTRVYGSAPVTPVEGAAELVRQQNVVMEASRLRIPALVHEECLTGFATFGATGIPRRSRGPRRSTRTSWSGWPPRSGATWLPSAYTKASRRCSTSYATTGGDASRRPWERIHTWLRLSVPPTFEGCRAPAYSPPSNTSPGTPAPERRATTRRCRWAAANFGTSSFRRSKPQWRLEAPAR